MGLRVQALRGGAYLAIREGMGIGVRLAGTLVVTRLIGPTNYGIYAGAQVAVAFLAIVAQLGVGVYVIRLEESPSMRTYHVALAVVLITAIVTMLLGIGASLIVSGRLVSPSSIAPFQVLVLTLPMNVAWTPAQAMLERNLQFRAMAFVEVGGDIVLCVTSITLAVLGFGVWAPVCGYVAWQAWLLLSSYAAARYRPRVQWDAATAKAMVKYGFGYSSGTWIYQTRELSGPIVVGSLLGPQALGYTALAARIGETLCFMARVTWRLSMPIFGRVQNDLRRLAAALQEAMALQLVALAPILIPFALIAKEAIPAVFGDAWTPVIELMPLVMLGFLLTAVFNIEATVLYVRRENAVMVLTNISRIALLFGLAFLLVPRWGTMGWAFAMAVHPLGYAWSARRAKQLLAIRYTPLLYWFVAFVPPLFVPNTSWPLSGLLLIPTLIVCSTRWARVQLREYAGYIRRAIGRSSSELGASPAP
jgi:O-antigen/teichoic acid export membrane protein